jgi:hypothetical protein
VRGAPITLSALLSHSIGIRTRQHLPVRSCTLLNQRPCSRPAFDPSPLKVYFASLGIPYFYEEQQIIKAAQEAKGDVSSICAFCARMKRGRLYACLRREGYNVLALGQHLDDLAESFVRRAHPIPLHPTLHQITSSHHTSVYPLGSAGACAVDGVWPVHSDRLLLNSR